MLLITPPHDGAKEFSVHISDELASGKVQHLPVGKREDRVANFIKLAVNAVLEKRVNHVFVLDGDTVIAALNRYALLSRRRELPPLSILMMRTAAPARGLSTVLSWHIKKALVLLLPRVWPNTSTYFLTDAFGLMRERKGFRSLKPVRNPPPDLTLSDRASIRERLGVDKSTFLVGLVGMINAYKRPELTLGALELLPASAQLLIAGPADERSSALIGNAMRKQGKSRIKRVDAYLKEVEIGEHLAACDAVVLTYENDDPSATLISAVRLGVPVIAGGSPWLTKLVRELGLGHVVDLTVEGVREGIAALMQNPTVFQGSIRKAEGLLDPSAFENTLVDGLPSRRGESSPSGLGD